MTDPRTLPIDASHDAARAAEPPPAAAPAPAVAAAAPEAVPTQRPSGPTLPSVQRFVATASAIALGILALYYGQPVLMPLAFAALLAFVLSPLVARLRRWHLPQGLAVGIVVLCTLALVGGVAVVVAQQAMALGRDLPAHQQTIQKKLRALLPASRSGSVVAGTSQVLDVVEGELKAARAALPGAKPQADRRSAPAAVVVEAAPEPPLKAIAGLMKRLLVPLASAALVVVLLAFMLSQRRDMRDRLVRLTGGDLHRMTDALNDAGRRVSRYLSVQLLLNAGFGLSMALGLWWIGVPGAMLWGCLAAALRFVPYLGPAVSALFPLVVAFAVDPGWEMVISTAALIVVLELVSNNIVEPLAYSGSTGVSPVAVVASAAFWALVWGPVGLVLATPLTVCLVVLGRHVRPLRFLDLLLGNAPVFDQPMQLYQRLISGDRDEAIELGRHAVAETSLRDFYSEVAVPTLALAAHSAQGTAVHRHRLMAGVGALLEELAPAAEPKRAARTSTLCMGMRSEFDALSAEMLAQALVDAGVAAAATPRAATSAEPVAALSLQGVRTICLCTFDAMPRAASRIVCRRLRRRSPGLRIVLASWAAPATPMAPGAANAWGADALVFSLAEATARLQADGNAAAVPVPSTATSAVASCARPHDEAVARHLREILGRDAQRAADVFGVPLATVVLRTGEERGLWAHAGTATWTQQEAAQLPPEASALGSVLAGGEALVLADVAREPQFAGHQAVQHDGLHFFAGAALALPGGIVVGALSIHDTGPRAFDDDELRLLKRMAADLANLVAELDGVVITACARPATAGWSVPTHKEPA